LRACAGRVQNEARDQFWTLDHGPELNESEARCTIGFGALTRRAHSTDTPRSLSQSFICVHMEVWGMWQDQADEGWKINDRERLWGEMKRWDSTSLGFRV
jgi:hypothetical protein